VHDSLRRFRKSKPPLEEDAARISQDGRIETWVEIAEYLRRDVKTVQRWERKSGLPVHRVQIGRGHPNVYAYAVELDAWLEAKTLAEQYPAPPPPTREQQIEERKASGPPKQAAAVVAAVALLIAVGLFVSWPGPPPPVEPPVERPFTQKIGHEDHAAVSPDGTRIAFIWDRDEGSGGDLYVQSLDSVDPIRLTDTPGREVGPEWSPDGKRIAFKRTEDGDCTLLVVDAEAEGATPQSLVEREKCGGLYFSSWSPDGEHLAFIDFENRRASLSLYSFADGSVRVLKPPSLVGRTPIDQHPSFSPDGRRLVVTRIQDGDPRAVVLNLDGEELQSFATKANGRHVFSADGKSLIFARRGAYGGQLQRIRLRDGVVSNIPFGSVESRDPAVRGDLLAYTRWRYVSTLRRVELRDGKTVPGSERVMLASTTADHSPAISADGTRIAFVSDRSGTEEIWICNIDGTGLRRLTSLDVQGTGSPQWSPDGEWVAFDSAGDAGHDTAIFVVSSLGGEPRRLTSGNPIAHAPGWSADGQWLYFDFRATIPSAVWKAPATGGAAVQVTSARGFEPRESTDGQKFYFAPAPGVMGLWEFDHQTGEAAPVPELAEAGFHRYWALARDALYFVPGDAPPGSEGPFEIKRYDFADGQVTHVGTIDHPLVDGPSGLAVTSDESALVFATVELDDRDVMVVEGFR